MKKALIGAALLASMMMSTAQAETSKLYYGVGLADGTVDINGNEDQNMGTLTGTAGLELWNLIGVEGALGLASDDVDSLLSEPQVSYAAAMLRVGFRVGRFGIYALGGQAFLDSASTLNFNTSGMAYGMGINLFGNGTTALNFHYLNLDDGAFSTASIGFQHYFGGYR